jgi:nucleoside phosphorylase/CheY-like chemotaxis protein
MKKVLIVDDKPDKYANLVSLVQRDQLIGDDIEVVTNVRDALNRLATNQYLVLVLDMFLPETPWDSPHEKGGVNLLTHLEEDDSLVRPKYIFGITASHDGNDPASIVFDSQPWVLVRTSGGQNWELRLSTLIQHAIDIQTSQADIEFLTDICLITALKDPEYKALCNAGVALDEPTMIDENTYVRRGKLTSKGRQLSVLTSHCSRMGSTESSLLTYKLINKFRPRIFGMTGICAGFEEKTIMGDVIIGNPVWDYVTSSRITVDLEGNRTISVAPDYQSLDQSVSARFDNLATDNTFLAEVYQGLPADKPRSHPRILVAPSASGPAVIADAAVFKDLRKDQHRSTIGLEMEAYGVYSAVRMTSRPRPLFFSAKAVCDHATFLKEDRYQNYASYTSAAVAIEYLRRYGSELCDIADQ